MLHFEHKAHSALGGVLAMALAAGCLVTTAFAADLNKNDTPEVETRASVAVYDANGGSGSDETVTYIVDGSDESVNPPVLTLSDLEPLGNGDYQATATIDGKEVIFYIHFDGEE